MRHILAIDGGRVDAGGKTGVETGVETRRL